MREEWKKVREDHHLDIPFAAYEAHLGREFSDIMQRARCRRRRRRPPDIRSRLDIRGALDGARLDQFLKWARKFTDGPAPLSILTAHPCAGPGWADMLRNSTTGGSRTVGNTAVALDAALEPLMHQSVVQALQGAGEEPTDFHEFLDSGGTIYLLGKDSEANSIAPLTTAVTEDPLAIAEAHAIASPAGRLDPALLAALDEAPNIAPIPSLRQRVADGRGRGYRR